MLLALLVFALLTLRLLPLMSSAEEEWFADLSNTPGPSLEDFLASDPSHLPFLQERPATAKDLVRYQIFADDWESIEHLQQVSASQGEPSPQEHANTSKIVAA